MSTEQPVCPVFEQFQKFVYKSYLFLRRAYWILFPMKQSQWAAMHLSHCLFNLWEHCLKDVCSITFNSFLTLVMSSTVWNLLPLSIMLRSGTEKIRRRGVRWKWGGGALKGRNRIFCQELSNWQCCVSRHIVMVEEPASHSPHFRSLSSYCSPQTSRNRQLKILIN
jgi:hypothetical protein